MIRVKKRFFIKTAKIHEFLFFKQFLLCYNTVEIK